MFTNSITFNEIVEKTKAMLGENYRDEEIDEVGTEDCILRKTYSDGDIAVDDKVGKLVIDHDDTVNLKTGDYDYDIKIIMDDYVKTLVVGTITLTEESSQDQAGE